MVVSTPQRTANGVAVAAAIHALLFASLMSLARAPHRDALIDPDGAVSKTLTWLADGPAGGRGGGGHREPGPARSLLRSGHDNHDLPSGAPAPTEAQPAVIKEPDPAFPVAVPVKPLGSSDEPIIGVIGAVPALGNSRGPGDDNGAGGGKGGGIGDRIGTTVGDNGSLGIGDGPGGFGGGGTQPAIVYMERPRYTTGAMQARVQGTVMVECIVQPTGMCTDIRVVRSLDRVFGLDEEAKRAAALWKFKPGERSGRPMPMVVRIELEFALR
jgi:protein TonB